MQASTRWRWRSSVTLSRILYFATSPSFRKPRSTGIWLRLWSFSAVGSAAAISMCELFSADVSNGLFSNLRPPNRERENHTTCVFVENTPLTLHTLFSRVLLTHILLLCKSHCQSFTYTIPRCCRAFSHSKFPE